MTSSVAIVEQPKPKGSGPDIADLVIDDIRERKRVGTERYGEPLRAHNGRDALVDGYQEAIDLTLYLRQEIQERETARSLIEGALSAFALSDDEREQHFDRRDWMQAARRFLGAEQTCTETLSSSGVETR